MDDSEVPSDEGELSFQGLPEFLAPEFSLFARARSMAGGVLPVGAGLHLSGFSHSFPDVVDEFFKAFTGGHEELEVRGVGDVCGGAGGIQYERSVEFFLSSLFR